MFLEETVTLLFDNVELGYWGALTNTLTGS